MVVPRILGDVAIQACNTRSGAKSLSARNYGMVRSLNGKSRVLPNSLDMRASRSRRSFMPVPGIWGIVSRIRWGTRPAIPAFHMLLAKGCGLCCRGHLLPIYFLYMFKISKVVGGFDDNPVKWGLSWRGSQCQNTLNRAVGALLNKARLRLRPSQRR